MMAYPDAMSDAINPPVVSGCPMMNFGMEADDTNPAIKSEILRAVKATQIMIEDLVKKGIHKGEFRSDWAYVEFGTVLFAMIKGGIMISRIMGSNKKTNVIIAYLKKSLNKIHCFMIDHYNFTVNLMSSL